MTLALSQFRDLLHECVARGEVLEPVRTLDPVRFVENGPLRRLLVVGSDFRERERRDTATTRSAGLRSQRCRGYVPSEVWRLPLFGIDFDEDHGGHHAEVLLKKAPEPDERVFVSDLNLRGPDLFLDLSEERSGVLFRHAPR
jgi:hypothetical protein